MNHGVVSLWSAVETVLPLSEADSRISQVLDVMVPVLGHGYLLKILKDLHTSLMQHAEQPYRDALAAVPESTIELEAAGALFGIRSNWSLLDSVYKELAMDPLLCNRIWSVSKRFNEPRRFEG